MLWFLKVYFYFTNVFLLIHCYNLDVEYPIIVQDPSASNERSYFGYSVVLYRNENKENWLKVGAPRATYSKPNKIQQHSGIVYNCAYQNNNVSCHIEEGLGYAENNMTNSWAGCAMDIQYSSNTIGISASRFQIPDKKSGRPPQMPGAVFVEHLEKGAFQEKLSHLQSSSKIYNKELDKKVIYHTRALTGFSLNFLLKDEYELLVGAPGVYSYAGTIFRVKNIRESIIHWKYDVLTPLEKIDEYAGYAVTSGRFYGDADVYYVSGAPRGKVDVKNYKNTIQSSTSHGWVALFTFNTNKRVSTKIPYEVGLPSSEVLYGKQFGEYFGSSLAAGDLNNDTFDDLIVGAPFRSNHENGFNHGSVYVFYGSKGNLKNTETLIKGKVSGGQFGSALMVLGDLDKDGYPELAISAPYEGTGAVYIYSFDAIRREMCETQKILGTKISPNLKGFGLSISRATDTDDNGFLDLAIGSAMSGHAVVFRSKPVVYVSGTILAPVNIPITSNRTLDIQCCYEFEGYNNFWMKRQITVDRKYHRFKYYDQKEKIIFLNSSVQCENITIERNITEETKVGANYKDPIKIVLTYDMPEQNSTTFCKDCPMFSKKSKKEDSKLVLWDTKCEHDGEKVACRSELEVTATFLNLKNKNISDLGEEDTIILGVTESVSFEVQIVNRGDPAFTPVLQIGLPKDVSLNPASGCDIRPDNKIECKCGEVMFTNKAVKFDLELKINTKETNPLTIVLNAITITENIRTNSSTSLVLKLKREADFFISRSSEEITYTYTEGEPITIRNMFQVEKFGPSPVLPVEVTIAVPYKMKGKDGVYKQFAQINGCNSTITDAKDISPIVRNETSPESLTSPKALTSPESLTTHYLNCSKEYVVCAVLKCVVFEESEESVTISVNVTADFQNLSGIMGKDWLTEAYQIYYTIDANISGLDFIQTGNRTDFIEISNVVVLSSAIKISLWVLIGSAAVGFLILLGATIGLAKAGFFERKQHKKLLEEKEADLILDEENDLSEGNEEIESDLETDTQTGSEEPKGNIRPDDLRKHNEETENVFIFH